MTQHWEKTREQGNRIASANDEAVLKLSSAGLAVSFAFMRFSGDDAVALGALQTAWVCWFLSTACLIVSFWFGMFGSWIRETGGPSWSVQREHLHPVAELRQRVLLSCRAVHVRCFSVHEHTRR